MTIRLKLRISAAVLAIGLMLGAGPAAASSTYGRTFANWLSVVLDCSGQPTPGVEARTPDERLIAIVARGDQGMLIYWTPTPEFALGQNVPFRLDIDGARFSERAVATRPDGVEVMGLNGDVMQALWHGHELTLDIGDDELKVDLLGFSDADIAARALRLGDGLAGVC